MIKTDKEEAGKLATMHNIFFYKTLFDRIRRAIKTGKKIVLDKVEKEYKKLL